MGIIRDLWNDPDPLKWFIFGSLGLSVVLSGTYYWQTGKSADLATAIKRFKAKPVREGDPAPKESVQGIVDKADQLAAYLKQIEDDPFANLEEDPGSFASNYVVKRSSPAMMPDPKVSTNAGAGGGQGYTDTDITVTFLPDKIFARDNIYKFLWNMEQSPLVVTTHFSLGPSDRNHKRGQTLSSDGTDFWKFESKFTVRRPKKAATPAGPAR